MQILDGVPAEKVFVVPDIVREHRGQQGQLRRELDIPDHVQIVLFCGRMVPEKGPIQVIEAFRAVLESLPNCMLIMAGDGQQLDECKRLAAPLANQVRFMGHVLDVGRLYADSDVFVAPSTGESFGIAAMEAAFASVPMVLANISPWKDLFLHGQHCEFVDGTNTAAIAKSIVTLLQDRAYAGRLSDNAMRLVRDSYSKAAAMHSLMHVYEYAMEHVRR
jgi:glycosyltransferase involved in cell wall biosynthesis